MKTPIPEAWQKKIEADADKYVYQCPNLRITADWVDSAHFAHTDGAYSWAQQTHKLLLALEYYDKHYSPNPRARETIAEFEAFLKEGV